MIGGKKVAVVIIALIIILSTAFIYIQTVESAYGERTPRRLIRIRATVLAVNDTGMTLQAGNRTFFTTCAGAWAYRIGNSTPQRGRWTDLKDYFSENDLIGLLAVPLRGRGAAYALAIKHPDKDLTMVRAWLLRLRRGSGVVRAAVPGKVVFTGNRIMVVAQRTGFVIGIVAGEWRDIATNETGPVTKFVSRGDRVIIFGMLGIKEFRGIHFQVMYVQRILDRTTNSTLVRASR